MKDANEYIEIENDNPIVYIYENLFKEIPEKENEDVKKLLNRFDFDNDGIISIVDLLIVNIIVMNVFIKNTDMFTNDTLMNLDNKTYNGKSFDFDNDGTIDTADYIFVTYNLNNYIHSFIDFNVSFEDSFDQYENGVSIRQKLVTNFYKSNNRFPTLDEYKQLRSDYISNNPIE